MKNPYDVYHDNRAYMGYLEAVKDIRRLSREISRDGEISLDEFIRETEVENDRFGYLHNEERDSLLEE